MSEIEKAPPLPPMDFAEWYYSINKKLDRLIKALASKDKDKLLTRVFGKGDTTGAATEILVDEATGKLRVKMG